MATSARWRSVSTSVPCSGKTAIPMLASTAIGTPWRDEGLVKPARDARGCLDRVGLRPHPREQDGELVAAETGDRVAFPDDVPEPPCQLDQQEVARLVPERVVDLLEAVEVEEHHRRRVPVASGGREGLAEAVAEERSVRERGEGVVERLPLVLLRLAAQPAGGAQREAEERRVEDGESREEQEVERPRVLGSRGRDRLVREVELEHAVGLRGTLELEGHVDLEQLAELPLACVLLVAEVRDLRLHGAPERVLELVRGREGSSDQAVVVRVDDLASPVPDLDARDVGARAGLDREIEFAEANERQTVLHRVTCEVWLDSDPCNERRRARRSLPRALAHLRLHEVREDEPDNDDRQQAYDAERRNVSRSRQPGALEKARVPHVGRMPDFQRRRGGPRHPFGAPRFATPAAETVSTSEEGGGAMDERDPEQALGEIGEKRAEGDEPSEEERVFLEAERVPLESDERPDRSDEGRGTPAY
jgi:hypothetical protein